MEYAKRDGDLERQTKRAKQLDAPIWLSEMVGRSYEGTSGCHTGY